MFLGNRALAFSRNPSSRNWGVRWRCASGKIIQRAGQGARRVPAARGAAPGPAASHPPCSLRRAAPGDCTLERAVCLHVSHLAQGKGK